MLNSILNFLDVLLMATGRIVMGFIFPRFGPSPDTPGGFLCHD
jgi:nitrate/nitrite transporter NarK